MWVTYDIDYDLIAITPSLLFWEIKNDDDSNAKCLSLNFLFFSISIYWG